MGNYSHVPQVLWDWHRDFVEGVPRRRAVGIEGSDAVCCDYLVVRGVACRIFDHVKLKGDKRDTRTPMRTNCKQAAGYSF